MGRARAAVTPVAGASINPASYGTHNWVTAANIADGYIGLPLAKTMQKVYLSHGEFPTQPPGEMRELNSVGCQFLVSVEPSTTLTPTEQNRLSAFLTMLNQAGMNYRVVLYSEANNQAFTTASQWFTYWSYYAPVIQSAGVHCGYDPGCNYLAIARAQQFFPANPTPDELWMDYYGTAFRAGARLDTLIGIAQAAGVPAGMGEWGWSSGPVVFNPMSIPWWNDYCSYLINLAQTGRLGLGALFWASTAQGRKDDVIGSANDPRIPGVRNVAAAVQAG